MDNKEQSEELVELIQGFCDIVMPGHNKAKGYINVRKKVEDLQIDARTYYHWKNMKAIPRLKDMLEKLNKKGYTLQIVPMYDKN